MMGNIHSLKITKTPEPRYAYYRRCQEFRRNGEQCKAPAEKGSRICHAHAGQKAMAQRRNGERMAVLEEAAAQMRKRGRPMFKVVELFTNFNGIQVTIAAMAKALIDGRIDCKTAGRLAVDLQTMSKLLWIAQKASKTSPRINTDLKDLPNKQERCAAKNSIVNRHEEARILKSRVFEFSYRDRRANGPPEWARAA